MSLPSSLESDKATVAVKICTLCLPGDVVKISEDFGTETAFGEGYRRGDFRANTEDILTDDTPE